MSSVLKSLVRSLYKFVLRRPSVDLELVQRFVAANSPHWAVAKGEGASPGCVLIEGFHQRPNHVMQMARAAVALRERRGFTSLVLCSRGIFDRPEYKDYYRSFGIHSFANILSRFFMPALLVRSLWRTLRVYCNLGCPESLLEVKLEGMPIGGLLYNSYLRTHGTPTIWKRGPYLLPFLFLNISLYHYYLYLVNKKRVAHVVLGAWETALFGLLIRIAAANGIPVTIIGGTFGRAYGRTYLDFQDTLQHPLRPPVHLVERVSRNPAVIGAADRYLSSRLVGEIEDNDARSAYRGKRVMAREELAKASDLDPSLPNVFIMAHVFCDNPCGGGPSLFLDYYWWLRATMEATRDIPSCNWIVKPHPSAYVYGESGTVERLVDQLSIPRIHLAPPDLSTASLINVADALVTARGTAALEFACFGIPSLVSGTSSHSGFSITGEPQTQEEYFDLLRNLHLLPRLTDEQIARAKALIFLTSVATEHPSAILPNELIQGEILMFGDSASHRAAQSKMLLPTVEALESGCTPRDPYFEALSAFLESGDSHFYDETLIPLKPEETGGGIPSANSG